MNKPRCAHIVDNYASDYEDKICGCELPCPVHWPDYKPGDLTEWPDKPACVIAKPLLHEPEIRVVLRAEASNFEIAVPVRLTGVYDRGYTIEDTTNPRGCCIRVCSVEVQFSTGERRFVKLGDLCEEGGYRMDYWRVRRAILLQWMNQSYPEAPRSDGLTPYERACARD